MDPAGGKGSAIPASVGIGLRAPHVAEVLGTRPAIGWFEVHAENYMDPGPAREQLLRVRRDYPVSLHGVGLSIGSAEGIDRDHLRRLKELVALVDPVRVSEHLAWSVSDGVYLNDLLPLPYTDEALALVGRNIDVVQQALGRAVLIENPSRYLRFKHSTIAEPEFLWALVRRTGCGLLCDVNNVHVSCTNFGENAAAYIGGLPPDAIGEIHLAGHSRGERSGRPLLIDDHASPVSPAVWDLHLRALGRFGVVPTLVEWDRQLPALAVLLAEARRAERAAEVAGDASAGSDVRAS